MLSDQMRLAITAARRAGEVIMTHYKGSDDFSLKLDGSPVTRADQAAHQVITETLIQSVYPMVSEEGSDLLIDAKAYWLVDPLDGTKDYLAGNDEFTVNIALVIEHQPVLGVVYAPALDTLFAGEQGAAWYEKNGLRVDCHRVEKRQQLRMAVSRFHDHPDVDVFARLNAVTQRVPMGSALKYGCLATAEVDVFPRLVGCSEWDTAAGQAIVEAAGGQVLVWGSDQPLLYGKAGRRNPRLLSFRAPYLADEFQMMRYETSIV